jgi:hypothetical protein
MTGFNKDWNALRNFNKTKIVEAHRVVRSCLPHFLDNWLTDGSEAVSLSCWLPYPKEDPWYSFLLEVESTPGS